MLESFRVNVPTCQKTKPPSPSQEESLMPKSDEEETKLPFEHLQSQTRKPVLTKSKAKRFKVDRLEMYPKDEVQGSGPAPLDDCLTSLNWLHNFSILSADPERPSGPGCPSSQEQLFYESFDTDSPSSPAPGDTAATGMPQYLGSDSTVGPLFSRYPHIQMQPIPLVEVDYKTNPKAKPPHSHSSLIYMAMQASEQPKVTLSTIIIEKSGWTEISLFLNVGTITVYIHIITQLNRRR
ncbi:forkhead box protein J1-B-like [Gouania willdenowi]|uniref:forkhead box protein J1-B-like n=1 Tax=Gouania willdenowi TaxID=441366 RepID=UPI00105420D4|nr:forkhead box protein J1-B-like [Gouania willdenowi]